MILPMLEADRESQFRRMRDTARDIFRQALSEASITRAFARHVHCERGVLRLCEDLYDLQAYSRVLVISIGKAGHTMAEALAEQVGAGYQRKIDENNPAGVDAGEAKVNLAWVDKLEGKGQLSAVGDAVREVISRKRGQPLAGILLISDGASNSGVQPLDAATLAQCLAGEPKAKSALEKYEAQRRPATSDIILANRQSPPDTIIEKVEGRTGGSRFDAIDEIATSDELRAISENYQRVTGAFGA